MSKNSEHTIIVRVFDLNNPFRLDPLVHYVNGRLDREGHYDHADEEIEVFLVGDWPESYELLPPTNND